MASPAPPAPSTPVSHEEEVRAFFAQEVPPVPLVRTLAGGTDAEADAKACKLAQLTAARMIKSGAPFVWSNSGLARPAVASWSLDYLHEHAAPDAPFSVRSSTGTFLFGDERRALARFDVGAVNVDVEDQPFASFFADFVERSWEAGYMPFEPAAPDGEGGTAAPPPLARDAPQPLCALLQHSSSSSSSSRIPSPGHTALNPLPLPPYGASGGTGRLYLQQTLVTGIGERLTEDFRNFDWGTLTLLERAGGWGSLTSNLLMIGARGVLTPLHYDEQQNLLVALRGRKLVLLAAPEHFPCFYPFPIGHPADRQAAVDLRAPDLARFPALRRARFLYALLEPGDTLYLPSYWWHEVHHPWDDTCAVNFWFASAAKERALPELPLRDASKRQALRRNLEKIVLTSLGDGAPDFWRAVASDSAGDSKRHTAMVEQLAALLGQLLDRADIAPFMRELAEGRFEWPLQPSEPAGEPGAPAEPAQLPVGDREVLVD